MRKIKFRGRDWETGEYLYGDLIQGNYDEVCPRIKPRKKKARYVKDVAQLVGYDANGKEVYEGDTVVDERDGEWKAIIYSSLTLPFETDNGDSTVWGQGVTLKGGDQ